MNFVKVLSRKHTMSVQILRENFLDDLDFVKRMGGRLFLRPFAAKSKKQLTFFSFILFLVFVISIQLLVNLWLYGLGDWLEFVNIAPNIGACFISVVKYITINNNRDFYDTIFKHFYSNLWELIPENSTENKKIFMKYTKFSKMIKKTLLVFSVGVIVVVDSFPWLLMTFGNQFFGTDSVYLFPIDIWYPFDREKCYFVAYMWESLMTAVVILLYFFANMVHVSYVTYICMELSLLGNCLQNLLSGNDINHIVHGKNLKEIHGRVKNNLKSLIKRYEFLNQISARLDKVLGNVMFLAYAFDTVFICLTAFTFTVTDDFYLSIRYFSFFISVFLEMFVQCIMGQVLVDHSLALTEKIYFADWIYTDQETRKILLMLLLRTQTPFKLTAKRYVIMNLSTFSQICSSSFQLFNLLRTLYEPK